MLESQASHLEYGPYREMGSNGGLEDAIDPHRLLVSSRSIADAED